MIEAEYESGEIYNDSFVPHPFFDPRDNYKFNIGLIHLCRAIIFSINIQPAKLPFRIEQSERRYKDMTVVGFGDMYGGEVN